MPLSGREKATILLSILGTEASAKILRYLPGELADLIAAGVEHLPSPSPEALTLILDEFNRYAALPPYREAPLIEEEIRPMAKDPKTLLLSSNPKRIALGLLHERPQVVAFVLSLLPPIQMADILAYLPENRKEIENFIRNIKKNSLSGKIEKNILETLAKKLGS